MKHPPLQQPLFRPKVEWAPPSIAALPSWAGAGRVSIDAETCDPKLKELGPGVRRGAYMAGVAFAIEDGPSAYLPIAHAGGDNLDRDHVLSYLRDNAGVFKGDLAGTNLQYDLDFLAEAGVTFTPRFFRDVQIAEPLLDELQDHYSLDAIAHRHDLVGKDRESLNDACAQWGIPAGAAECWKLPARHVAAYAEQDVRLPLQLLRLQERRIDDNDLWAVYDLESRVLPVLVKMRRRGVRVDFDRLDAIEARAVREEQTALAQVKALCGVTIPFDSCATARLVAPALEAIGVVVPRTRAGNASVDIELLEATDHDVARAIMRARRWYRVRTTFVASVRAHATNGRIHCTFNQMRKSSDDDSIGDDRGARYGRMSCSDPNLQQQPKRDEDIGPLWRAIYLPDEGGEWCSADFSSQEPRMAVHYATKMQLSGAEDAAERYRKNPKHDFHAMTAELTGLPRVRAKDVFLGRCYGMGPAKFCKTVKLPTKWIVSKGGNEIEVAGDEGEEMLATFDARVPFVKKLSDACERAAKERGVIITIAGRRLHFPKRKDGKGYDWTYKALNRLIQGSSGDQTKAAIVAADAAGYHLQLQVHDELDGTVQDRAEGEGLAAVMCEALPLCVPSLVKVEIGPSWGEAK